MLWFYLMIGMIMGATILVARKYKDSDLYVWGVVPTLFALIGLFVLGAQGDEIVFRVNDPVNWFAVTIIVIWISAAVGGLVGNELISIGDCLASACITSLLMGIGYGSTILLVEYDRAAPNWYALTTIGLWISAAAVSIRVRQAALYGMAAVLSLILGAIYLTIAFP